MAREGTSVEKAQTAPHEDDSRKPDSPADLTRPSWRYTATKALTEFGRDQCTDLAAALTYYAVLAIFPAMLALVSLLGVFGQGQSTTDALLDIVRQLGQGSAADALQGPIEQVTQTRAAGLAFIVGILGAIWSASGYVGAFGRAMNRIYQIDEGRPVWKLRPLQLVLTLAGIILVALVLIGLVVSGSLAESIGDVIGLGDTAVTAWNIAKWPVMLAIVIALVAVLYYATPNVKQPKFRWMSVGAAIAILTWLVASVAFGFYVANFGSYNQTYGSLAGVIVFLLWLWLTNLALLFGAEVDAELERSRQLQAGIAAEESLAAPAAGHPRLRQEGRKVRGTHRGGAPPARAGRAERPWATATTSVERGRAAYLDRWRDAPSTRGMPRGPGPIW